MPSETCEALYLHANQIVELPDFAFGKLKNLKELYLDWNNLTRIDKSSLGGLRNLEVFQASRNKINYGTEFKNNHLKQAPHRLF